MAFEDRVSTYPNRYILTTEDGSVSYVILERADEPVTPGTPLNAETFNAMREELEQYAESLVQTEHIHDAADVTSGTFSIARIPTITVAKGGTGSTNGATGLKNLFAAGNTVLSSYQYGTSLPTAGTKGRIFFKKVT